MSDTVSSGAPAASSSEDRNLAFVVYALLFCSPFLWGVTGLVGVVIAYVRRPERAGVTRSHYNFQIKAFWISVVLLAIAAVSFLFGMGVLFSDLFAAATNGGQGWDAWEAAAFDAEDLRFHGEMVVGFVVAVIFVIVSSLWLLASSLFGVARLAGDHPIGRA